MKDSGSASHDSFIVGLYPPPLCLLLGSPLIFACVLIPRRFFLLLLFRGFLVSMAFSRNGDWIRVAGTADLWGVEYSARAKAGAWICQRRSGGSQQLAGPGIGRGMGMPLQVTSNSQKYSFFIGRCLEGSQRSWGYPTVACEEGAFRSYRPVRTRWSKSRIFGFSGVWA